MIAFWKLQIPSYRAWTYNGLLHHHPSSLRTIHLLKMILGVKIDHIEYPELQKTINARYESKSIRLDVYVEDGEGTVLSN